MDVYFFHEEIPSRFVFLLISCVDPIHLGRAGNSPSPLHLVFLTNPLGLAPHDSSRFAHLMHRRNFCDEYSAAVREFATGQLQRASKHGSEVEGAAQIGKGGDFEYMPRRR